MVVQALLNDNVTSPLLVDTGAELTVISPAVARRLGLNLDLAVFIPLRSASGVFLAPLTKIQSLTVGAATVRELEVIVHDAAPGIDGLLGMSFLDNFAVTIRAAEQAMILTDMSTAPGAALYEGRSKEWWQRKFRFYRRQIEEIKAYMTVQAAPHFERTLRYLQQELATLERRATLASLPKHWR
jgi:clan AA aspartic protease (TIGR02281 family)